MGLGQWDVHTSQAEKSGIRDKVHRRARRARFTLLGVKMDDAVKDQQVDCLQMTRGFFEGGSSICREGFIGESG